MAVLTPLALDEARRLGAEFGLEVVSVEGILAGSVNSNYRLGIAGGGSAFLRIYEEQGPEAAAREVGLLEQLSARGVPTPRPLPRARAAGSVPQHAGKAVAVFPWIEGEVLCQARVTPARMAAVGEALGKLHRAGAGLAAPPAGRFGPTQLAARLDGLSGRELGTELVDAVRLLRDRLQATSAPAQGRGVIHGDLFRDNVLWEPSAEPAADIRALLDFESASLGSFAFDLAVTALAWCFGERLEAELVTALGAGYRSVRPLDAEDLRELPAQARFAALRFAITRITDFELRPRGAGVYKDYRRFLARLAALETLGDDGIRALLAG